MKIVKKFKQFIDMGFKTVGSFCEENYIFNWTEREDGTVDVNNDVSFMSDTMDKMPFKFGEVTGNFNASYKKFKELKDFPDRVGKSFIIDGNLLTDLKGCPKKVGSFSARNNKLTTLEGITQKINGSCDVSLNKLTSLVGLPKIIYGKTLDIGRNPIELPDGFPTDFTGKTACGGYAPIHEVMNLFFKKKWHGDPDDRVIDGMPIGTNLGGKGDLLCGGDESPKRIYTILYQTLQEYDVVRKENGKLIVLYDRLMEAHSEISSMSSGGGGIVEELGDFKLRSYEIE